MIKSSRNARRIVRDRQAAARNARRTHTLASHARMAGIFDNDTPGVAGALRAKGKACGITGEAARLFRRNQAGQKMWRKPVAGGRRYTKDEVATLAAAYRPRVAKYALARRQLLAYAAS